jgi:hypothetical protein
VLEFDSLEMIKKATDSPGAAEVFDDIENFSSEKPTIMTGEVQGTS